ncbi:RING zinc finger [Chlorella sorokiniana]|uniref:RING zinc finger n=1 Tax=Chlorella sorokiniana TaxID=3076 RepID=A0A2P6TGF0_CHLSO|nr:RING zinc finger [Chlorella sorokiniana]|eukprot:PRW33189.1 RING zinc finger [Chlorella sorokiniana]
MRALLGDAAGDAAGSSSGGQAADGAGPSNAAGPSTSSNAQQVLKLAAAAVRQLAKGKRPAEPTAPAIPECSICMERLVCMAGPCGHLVCEECAEKDQIKRYCPDCRKRHTLYKLYL